MSPRSFALVALPFVVMAGVGAGLAMGAPGNLVGARVYAYPQAAAGAKLVLRVVVLRRSGGVTVPLPATAIEASTDDAGRADRPDRANPSQWRGATSDDGTAEITLDGPLRGQASIELRARNSVLVSGRFRVPVAAGPSGDAAWLPFGRREGDVVLQAATLGARAAPGFPASVWVRAKSQLGEPLRDVRVRAEADASLLGSREAVTDAAGWAELIVTPVGLAVGLRLRARTASGALGTWDGGLAMAPGGTRLETSLRVRPDEDLIVSVTAPVPRASMEIAIDDARGRAFAGRIELASDGRGMSTGVLHVPPLRPGLYWAVAAPQSLGEEMPPSATTRPFFVAKDDEAALAFGTEPSACAELGPCLAVVSPEVARPELVLDGLARMGEAEGARRARGLKLALGALLLGSGLEGGLLLVAAQSARRRLFAHALPVEVVQPRPFRAVLAAALAVALLGFAVIAWILGQG